MNVNVKLVREGPHGDYDRRRTGFADRVNRMGRPQTRRPPAGGGIAINQKKSLVHIMIRDDGHLCAATQSGG